MKKILAAVFVLTFASGAAFAGSGKYGEANIRLGADLGWSNAEQGKSPKGDYDGWLAGYDKKTSDTSNPGISFGAEYLYPVWSVFKAGAGVKYLLSRKIVAFDSYDEAGTVDLSASYIPVYFTVQANPVRSLQKLFFKGDIGYSFFSSGDFDKDTSKFFNDIVYPGDDDVVKASDKGGIYFSLAAGYELDCGLFFDLAYSYYASSTDLRDDWVGGGWDANSLDLSFATIGLNIGYKFKL